jgi:hypothetical protein
MRMHMLNSRARDTEGTLEAVSLNKVDITCDAASVV